MGGNLGLTVEEIWCPVGPQQINHTECMDFGAAVRSVFVCGAGCGAPSGAWWPLGIRTVGGYLDGCEVSCMGAWVDGCLERCVGWLWL